MGIHSYLTYLRDRLLLSRELLTESGSVFVQISDENVHLVRNLMDEVFGVINFISLISFTTTSGFPSNALSRAGDYIVWYAKDKERMKYYQLFGEKTLGGEKASQYKFVELPDGTIRALGEEEIENQESIPAKAKIIGTDNLYSDGATESGSFKFEYQGQIFDAGLNKHWKTTKEGMEKLAKAGRLIIKGKSLYYKRYLDDFPAFPISNLWIDTGRSFGKKDYVVQTSERVVERCILMTTDPGDLVLDPTCGSGTTAYVAEQWGRRWITCDTSRVATTLAKQRLMTALFDYYELAHPGEGVGSGFKYKTVPHVTLKSIANNEPPAQETLYDQPLVDK